MKLLPIFLSSAMLFGLAVVSIGCGGESVSVESTPEPAPSRGQRDRVMSELHGSRKLLGDALEAADATKFRAAGSGETASAAVAVAALIQMERALLDALQASTPVGTADPSENEALSPDERRAMNEEAATAMRNLITSCVDRIPASGMQASAEAASASPEEMLGAFRSARDATIAYARETEHNFLRRRIEVAPCGTVNLMTAMMLHAELTARVAEYVSAQSH